MVDTTDQWIVERTGIRQRHIVEKGVASSDLAVEAARKVLADRGITPGDVEPIIVATLTPDMMFPATACLPQNKLGAQPASAFDVSPPRPRFLYPLQPGP